MHVRRRLLKWGNGYGVRITKKEALRLGVKPGSEVDVDVEAPPVSEEIEALPTFRFGGDYDLDALIEEELDAGH